MINVSRYEQSQYLGWSSEMIHAGLPSVASCEDETMIMRSSPLPPGDQV